jgi:hypothetical protein
MTKAVELKKEKFTLQVKYSPEAIEKKLMKFITPSGDEFEISAEEMISILVSQVNNETLAPTFVETDRINVVEVARQLMCVLDEDMEKGQVIRMNYTHPYPLEFALIEEAYKIAAINKDAKVTELTSAMIEDVKKKTTPDMNDYINKFYKSFRQVKLPTPPIVG